MEIIKVNIPENISGNWKVEYFSVSEQDAKMFNLRLLINRQSYREIKPGNYTKLTCNGEIIMSDTPAEVKDHSEIIQKAKGEVLINGLGLGVVVQACLNKNEVEHLTVIEISKDVIDLVGLYYLNKYNERLTIIQTNALTYIPPKGERYNAVWHDIWNNICTDNWEQYKILHRKYGHKCDWQGSWCKWEVERKLKHNYE